MSVQQKINFSKIKETNEIDIDTDSEDKKEAKTAVLVSKIKA